MARITITVKRKRAGPAEVLEQETFEVSPEWARTLIDSLDELVAGLPGRPIVMTRKRTGGATVIDLTLGRESPPADRSPAPSFEQLFRRRCLPAVRAGPDPQPGDVITVSGTAGRAQTGIMTGRQGDRYDLVGPDGRPDFGPLLKPDDPGPG